MSIREDAIMMLLSGGGGSADVAELTVDANGTYEAVNYTNVDGVATLITDPDTQKSLDGFNPVNVQIDIEEEKKKAYDEGYSDGYADGQQDPDPTIIQEIIDKLTPKGETFGGEGEDPSDTIDNILEYYRTHPPVTEPPFGFGVSMDVEGEKTPTGSVKFVVTNIGSMKGCVILIGDKSVWTWASGNPTTTYSEMYVDTNGTAHATATSVDGKGETHTDHLSIQIPQNYLVDTTGTPYTVTMHYNYSYNP